MLKIIKKITLCILFSCYLSHALEKKEYFPDLKDMFFNSIKEGDLESVKQMLDFVDHDIETEIGLNGLHLAVCYNQIEIVKLLLDKGFNPNLKTKSKYGWAPIHWAAHYGYTAIIKLLIKYDADIEQTNIDGCNAVHFSISNGHHETLKILLENDADPNVELKSDKGWTALHWAAKNDDLKSAELLLAKKAKVDIKNEKEETPLMMAIAKNHQDIIDILSKDKKLVSKPVKRLRNA